MLITFPLMIMSVLTFFNMLLSEGELTSIAIDFLGTSFELDPVVGVIAVLTVSIIVGTAGGCNILGSGLNEGAVRSLTIGTMYGGLWALLSLMSMNLLINIPEVGALIWVSLTILYVIGVYNKYAGV